MSTIYDHLTLLNDRSKKVYAVTNATVPEEYTMYTNKVTDNKYQYMMQGVTALAMGQIIADGQIPASDAPLQGFNITFNQAIFTHRVRLSQQDMFYLIDAKRPDLLDERVKKLIVNLKNAVINLKNYYAESMLANGASTSFSFSSIGFIALGTTTVTTTGADGVAYWSASHPREDGGTAWSNIIQSSGGTNNPPLSFANILAARVIHAAKKDGRGLPLMGSTLDTVVVVKDSQNDFLATSIAKTLESGKYPSATPGTTGAFVDVNPISSFNVMRLARYDGTALTQVQWLMMDSAKKNDEFGFQYVVSKEMESPEWVCDEIGNKDYVATVEEYCQFGAADLRYWMYSSGLSA